MARPGRKPKTSGKLSRQSRAYPLRKVFVVAFEGRKAEGGYFGALENLRSRQQQREAPVRRVPSNDKSAPLHVLNKMKRYLERNRARLREGPWEAWLVIDRDNWQPQHIAELDAWGQHEGCQLAVSNPLFELWLLLHFVDEHPPDPTVCKKRLRVCLPDYDQAIASSMIDLEKVRLAVKRAAQQDDPPCEGWPREPGITTVYRLIENILGA